MNRCRVHRAAVTPNLSPELQYRLEFLRVVNAAIDLSDCTQEHSPNSAFAKMIAWARENLVLRAARESCDELGPIGNAAEKEFLRSLEAK